MLVSEFEKRIKNIDSHLYVEMGDGLPAMIKVKYSLINDNPSPVMIIGINGDLDTCNRGFQLVINKNKRKLLLASVDMSMTPLDKRVEHKWHVIVGNDSSEFSSIICWGKEDNEYINPTYLLCLADSNSLAHNNDVTFTDEEFSNLIKYIKTLPDGEYQAKVAEHGKTEV